jgi:hypothetical protein
VGVAFALFWLRQERAPRCRHGVVDAAAGRDQIPVRLRGLGFAEAPPRRRLWQDTQVLTGDKSSSQLRVREVHRAENDGCAAKGERSSATRCRHALGRKESPMLNSFQIS